MVIATREIEVKVTEAEIVQLVCQAASLAKRAGISKTALRDYINGVYRA